MEQIQSQMDFQRAVHVAVSIFHVKVYAASSSCLISPIRSVFLLHQCSAGDAESAVLAEHFVELLWVGFLLLHKHLPLKPELL